MELIKEYPVLFRYIIVSVCLVLIYYGSGYFIKIFKLKVSRWQFTVAIFGLYLATDFVVSLF